MSLPARRSLLLTTGAAAAAFALCWVLALAAWPGVRHADAGLVSAAHGAASAQGWLRLLALGITDLGSPVAVDVVAVLAVGWLLYRRWWRAAAVVAVARLGELGTESAVKAIVGRPRPHLLPALTSATGSSFPSGHAGGSAAVYGALALVLLLVLSRRGARWALAGAAALVLAVAASRVVLGMHYPTDVLAGIALGLAWAGGAALALPAARPAVVAGEPAARVGEVG